MMLNSFDITYLNCKETVTDYASCGILEMDILTQLNHNIDTKNCKVKADNNGASPVHP